MADQQDIDVHVTKNYQLRGRLSAPENFVDGVSFMFIGYPMTKMLLHTVVEPKNGEHPEIRKAVQYLTMPTVNAIELAEFILNTAKKAEAQLVADLNPTNQKKIRDILKRFQANETRESESVNLLETSDSLPSQRKAKLTKKAST